MKLFIAFIIIIAGADCLCGEPPAKPFGKTVRVKPGLEVAVEFSDGKKIEKAMLYVQADYEITIFADKKRHKVKVADISSLSVKCAEEGLEKQWRWKEGGSDEKVYTGKSYPWRKYSFDLTKRDGTKLSGSLTTGFPVGLSWLEEKTLENGEVEQVPLNEKYIIKPRDKGKLGTTLEELVYIKELKFSKLVADEEKEEKDVPQKEEQG